MLERYGSSSNVDIKKCKNTAAIQAENNTVGGIVGVVQYSSNVTIDTSYNTGYVLAGVYSSGGILGCVYGAETIINDCYNIGMIEAKTGSLGGIIGNIEVVDEIQPYAEVSNCYNAGVISRNGVYGGIIGYHKGTSSYKTSNNYWLSTCGADYGIGYDSSDDEAQSKTQVEMQKLASTLGGEFVGDILEESKIWKYNNGYPILKWQATE